MKNILKIYLANRIHAYNKVYCISLSEVYATNTRGWLTLEIPSKTASCENIFLIQYCF